MNLADFLRKEGQIWSRFCNHDSDYVETSTVSYSPCKEEGSVVHSRHHAKDLSTWSFCSTIENACQDTGSRLLRVVWVERNPSDKTDHIAAADLAHVVQSFGLGRAQEHSTTAFAGVERVPNATLGSNKTAIQYCFRIHPKVVVLWSVSPDRYCVQGICFAGKHQLARLKQLLDPLWKDYATLLPTACATVFSIEVDETNAKIKSDIRAVESRTGYHKWESRKECSAEGELGSLSALMSGSATKSAATIRKIKVIEQLLDFLGVPRDSQQQYTDIDRQDLPQCTLASDLHLLRERAKMQMIDCDLIRERINIQISALYNVITQNDGLSTYQSAEESRRIAMAGQRDSTSMRALAFVTMFYLPAQVVASIFAMPFFNETSTNSQNSASIINGRFWLYWVVTAPLTLATFAFAAVWLLVENRFITLKRGTTYPDAPPYANGTEISSLLRRRASTNMSQNRYRGPFG